MITKAFYERVLFEVVEENINKSPIIGISKSELVKIRILDWGTNRDGTPFGYEPGLIGYMKKEAMGIKLGDGKSLMDRGHVLGLE